MNIQSILTAGLLALLSFSAGAKSPELTLLPQPNQVPKAPADRDDQRNEPICMGEGSATSHATDQALVKAGWIPFHKSQQIGGTRVVAATASLDGDCLPRAMSVFIFRGNRLLAQVSGRDLMGIVSAKLVDETTVQVNSTFHLPNEPACCPTGAAQMVITVSDDHVVER